jgi:hypothetical protein
MGERIIVNVASYKRTESLIRTLESIINQCDEINVALNDHYMEEIPDFLHHNKINLFFTDNSIGDAFKFLNLEKVGGYYFSIDDDLIYPPTYVSDTIKKCKEFNNKKVVTYHGRNFSSFPISSYYRSASERYACLNKVKNDVRVQFGGTGVMCFHTSLMKIPINYFKNANMADVWVGKYCIENNIEIICLKHDEGYIKYIPQKTTIYNDESKSDKIQTDLVNGLFTPKIVETKIEDQNFEKQIELKNSIVLTQKQINYEKINSIFNFNNPNIVSKEKQEKQIINLKLNTSIHSKMFPKNKKR